MGLLGVFFFNFSMAITLASLANILSSAKGTGFGLASFSLAIGALPALLGLRLEHPLALFAMSLISAFALGVGLTLVKDSIVTGPFGHERSVQVLNEAQVGQSSQIEQATQESQTTQTIHVTPEASIAQTEHIAPGDESTATLGNEQHD